MQPEDMTPFDREQVRALHEKMGFDYRMPDLESPLFLVKQVVRDERGRVIAACGLRLQAETYLWLDTQLPIEVRCKVVRDLARSVVSEAWRAGLDCLVAWLPPGLPATFRNFLTKRLGWQPVRKGWESWTLPVE